MDTQNNSEQADIQESSTKKLDIDFSHRFASLSEADEEFDLCDLTDTITLMCERAEAVVTMVEIQMISEVRANSAILSASLSAAAKEIQDISSLITAYWHSQNQQA